MILTAAEKAIPGPKPDGARQDIDNIILYRHSVCAGQGIVLVLDLPPVIRSQDLRANPSAWRETSGMDRHITVQLRQSDSFFRQITPTSHLSTSGRVLHPREREPSASTTVGQMPAERLSTII
jgi:hypothetical protein